MRSPSLNDYPKDYFFPLVSPTLENFNVHSSNANQRDRTFLGPFSDNEKQLVEEMTTMKQQHHLTLKTYEDRISKLSSKLHELRYIAAVQENTTTESCSTRSNFTQNNLLNQDDTLSHLNNFLTSQPAPLRHPQRTPLNEQPQLINPTNITLEALEGQHLDIRRTTLTIWDTICNDDHRQEILKRRIHTTDSVKGLIKTNLYSDLVATRRMPQHQDFDKHTQLLESVPLSLTQFVHMIDTIDITQLENNGARVLADIVLSQNGKNFLTQPADCTEFSDLSHELWHLFSRLLTIKNPLEKAEFLLFCHKLPNDILDTDLQLRSIQEACVELCYSVHVKNVLKMLLILRNNLNICTGKSTTTAFDLSILLQLKNLPSDENPNITMLEHLLIMYCSIYDDRLNDRFLSELSHITTAAQVDLEELALAVSDLTHKFEFFRDSMLGTIESESSPESNATKIRLDSLLKTAESALSYQRELYNTTREQFRKTATYFAFSILPQEKSSKNFFALWALFVSDSRRIWKNIQQTVYHTNFYSTVQQPTSPSNNEDLHTHVPEYRQNTYGKDKFTNNFVSDPSKLTSPPKCFVSTPPNDSKIFRPTPMTTGTIVQNDDLYTQVMKVPLKHQNQTTNSRRSGEMDSFKNARSLDTKRIEGISSSNKENHPPSFVTLLRHENNVNENHIENQFPPNLLEDTTKLETKQSKLVKLKNTVLQKLSRDSESKTTRTRESYAQKHNKQYHQRESWPTSYQTERLDDRNEKSVKKSREIGDSAIASIRNTNNSNENDTRLRGSCGVINGNMYDRLYERKNKNKQPTNNYGRVNNTTSQDVVSSNTKKSILPLTDQTKPHSPQKMLNNSHHLTQDNGNYIMMGANYTNRVLNNNIRVEPLPPPKPNRAKKPNYNSTKGYKCEQIGLQTGDMVICSPDMSKKHQVFQNGKRADRPQSQQSNTDNSPEVNPPCSTNVINSSLSPHKYNGNRSRISSEINFLHDLRITQHHSDGHHFDKSNIAMTSTPLNTRKSNPLSVFTQRIFDGNTVDSTDYHGNDTPNYHENEQVFASKTTPEQISGNPKNSLKGAFPLLEFCASAVKSNKLETSQNLDTDTGQKCPGSSYGHPNDKYHHAVYKHQLRQAVRDTHLSEDHAKPFRHSLSPKTSLDHGNTSFLSHTSITV